MSKLIITNALFWQYKGQVKASWGLLWDGSTDAEREAYIKWLDKYKLNCAGPICLNNEGLMSLFENGFMKNWNPKRVNLTVAYIKRLKAKKKKVAVALYDGPAIPKGKYHPILDCPESKHFEFIKIVVQTLNPIVDLWLVGCETNRYWDSAKVERFIKEIKKYSGAHMVGTHEQGVGWRNNKWTMTRRIPKNAVFHCHETSNHPDNGDSRTVADMVGEVKFLCSQAKVPIWVGEHNLRPWEVIGKKQADNMAAVKGVYGMNY